MNTLAIPLGLDAVAVGFGGLAGALAARRRGFDIVGVLFLAVIGGLGGALLRDLLLQVPVRALTSPWLLPSAFIGGALVAPLLKVVGPMRFRRDAAFTLLDAISLAMYSTLGTDRAMTAGLPPISCLFVGTVAGVGGALIRDVLINEQPEHFKPGSFYVLAAIPGCIAYFVLRTLELPVLVSALISISVVIAIRMSSWSLDWQTGRRPSRPSRSARP
ncbi:trimeric intracellular cation channel family protein, partial [Knoellia subterranea]|uniref:trimeric intracellular cation channel family protein n=1 Tax=Knoellia subterranea TaxID=184882 RepID=UPI00056B0A00